MSTFDPYQIWLDIPPHERPVSYYRLLGLPLMESDPQRIAGAAHRTSAHIEQFRSGQHAAFCEQLLNEIHIASACLLDPTRKRAYDSGLQGQAGRPSISAPDERKLPSPQAERQIASTPPVPGSVGHADSPGGELPLASPAASGTSKPTSPAARTWHAAYPISGPPATPAGNAETAEPIASRGAVVPLGQPVASPIHREPATHESQPAASAPLAHPVATEATPVAVPLPPATPSEASPAPPSWAPADRSGEVSTVTAAGQGSADSARTTRGKQLRSRQGKQSAYMLLAVAMAVIVLFFGVVAALAVFYDG